MGLKSYISESYNELVHKVSWPTWKELQSSAIVVLVAALLFSLLIWAMDYVFGVRNMNDSSFWKGLLGFVYKLLGH